MQSRTLRSPLRVAPQPHAARRGAGENVGGRGETPRQRFQRIGQARVAKAAQSIRLLQQFGNPAVYEVRPQDREKIARVLSQELEQLLYVLTHPGKAAPLVTFDDEDEDEYAGG